MSAQKPIVASNIEGYSSLIKDNYNGILTEPKNPESIANALEILINNKKLKTKISNNAFKVANEYSWQNVTEKILQVYKHATLKY